MIRSKCSGTKVRIPGRFNVGKLEEEIRKLEIPINIKKKRLKTIIKGSSDGYKFRIMVSPVKFEYKIISNRGVDYIESTEIYKLLESY